MKYQIFKTDKIPSKAPKGKVIWNRIDNWAVIIEDKTYYGAKSKKQLKQSLDKQEGEKVTYEYYDNDNS